MEVFLRLGSSLQFVFGFHRNPDILEYMLTPLSSILAFGSLWVHLAAICAFHPPLDNSSVFMHPVTARFLKGILKSFPPVVKIKPKCDLRYVLTFPLSCWPHAYDLSVHEDGLSDSYHVGQKS